MQVTKALEKIKDGLPAGVKLIAISKTQSTGIILQVYQSGHKIFGENKVQELVKKYEELPKDIEWHMVGHLQTNKVKFIVPFVHMIHGIDSQKLLWVIDNEAQKAGRTIPCLLQVRIAKEETKFGLTEQALEEIIQDYIRMRPGHVRIEGLMGMATYTDNDGQVHDEFRKLKAIFMKMKNTYFADDSFFRELSMGMSGDYTIAMQEGSTMVRIGSLIFGERVYLPNIEKNEFNAD